MKKLTSAEFDEAIKFVPGMEDHNIRAARLVLVDGLTYVAAAAECGGTRQWVQKKVDRIYGAFLENNTTCPSGWFRLSVCVPSREAITEIKNIEKKYTKESKQTSKK